MKTKVTTNDLYIAELEHIERKLRILDNLKLDRSLYIASYESENELGIDFSIEEEVISAIRNIYSDRYKTLEQKILKVVNSAE